MSAEHGILPHNLFVQPTVSSRNSRQGEISNAI